MPSFGSMVIFTTLPSSLKNRLNFSGPMSTFLSVFSTARRPVYEIVQDVVGADGSYAAQFGAIRAHFCAIL